MACRNDCLLPLTSGGILDRSPGGGGRLWAVVSVIAKLLSLPSENRTHTTGQARQSNGVIVAAEGDNNQSANRSW